MSKCHVLTVAALAVAVFVVSPVRADDQNVERFHARLVGFNEIGGLGVGETGVILSSGTGTADVKLNKSATQFRMSSESCTAFVHLGFGSPLQTKELLFPRRGRA